MTGARNAPPQMIPAMLINARKSQPADPGIGRLQRNQCVKFVLSSLTASDWSVTVETLEDWKLPLAVSHRSLQRGQTSLAALNAAAHQGMLQAVNKIEQPNSRGIIQQFKYD